MTAAILAAGRGVFAAHRGDLKECGTRTKLWAHNWNKRIGELGKRKKQSTYGIGSYTPGKRRRTDHSLGHKSFCGSRRPDWRRRPLASSSHLLLLTRRAPSASPGAQMLLLVLLLPLAFVPLPASPVAQLFPLFLLVLSCTVRSRCRSVSSSGSAGGSLVALHACPTGTRHGRVCSPPGHCTAPCRRNLGSSQPPPLPRRWAGVGLGLRMT